MHCNTNIAIKLKFKITKCLSFGKTESNEWKRKKSKKNIQSSQKIQKFIQQCLYGNQYTSELMPDLQTACKLNEEYNPQRYPVTTIKSKLDIKISTLKITKRSR